MNLVVLFTVAAGALLLGLIAGAMLNGRGYDNGYTAGYNKGALDMFNTAASFDPKSAASSQDEDPRG